MKINNKEYKEIKLLGKGKSGYSFLVQDVDLNFYVAKKIHHEQCDYYTFTDKLQSEIDDYNYLKNILNLPKLLDVDYENEIILKEYLDEITIKDMIDNKQNIDNILPMIREISKTCESNGINIDYYPSNFILYNGKMFYIDFECNSYDEKWNFENWGSKYWN